MVEYSHARVSNAVRRAEDALEDLKLAAEELLVGSTGVENYKASASKSLTKSDENDLTKSVVDEPVVEPEDSSSAMALIIIGLAVVAYFAWTRFSKRRRYQNIPSDGWGGTGKV